jgi:TonB family protein
VKGSIFYLRCAAAILLAMPLVALAATTLPHADSTALEQRESHVSRTLKRTAQFVDVHHINRRWPCEQVQAPVALTTPDPVLSLALHGSRVRVSFIIGIDGGVRSPLILESAGMAGDRRVIETVRRWRYRPATCNGAPTETEGKVEFSIR